MKNYKFSGVAFRWHHEYLEAVTEEETVTIYTAAPPTGKNRWHAPPPCQGWGCSREPVVSFEKETPFKSLLIEKVKERLE